VTSSDAAEASVSAASLTFTGGNWNINQTITVTGLDDPTLDGTKGYTIVLGAPTLSADAVYAAIDPTDVNGSNIEAAYSCEEWHTVHPLLTSGTFPLDTDRTGTASGVFDAHCDMTTDGGGWTLLSWTADSDVGTKGAPYPGHAACVGLGCVRGTGVPAASVNALIGRSTELGQGQSTSSHFKATFGELATYEYAGSYVYPSLAGFSLAGAFGGCAGLVTGVYNDLVGTSGSDNTTVYLNQGFVRDGDGNFGNFSAGTNSYTWSIGVPGAYCTLSGAMPSSYLGTWNAGQYGPGQPSASGSYSVWVR
jgi:hypothetical protein